MKKILVIMSSLTILISGTTTAIACQIEPQPQSELLVRQAQRNDLNNLVGGAFNQAKAMVLDNEFGIGQQASNALINRQLASEAISDFNPRDPGLNGQSRVGDVVSQYFQTPTNNYRELNSTNIHLGNTKGVESGLNSLIPENLRETIIPIKDLLMGLLEANPQYLQGSQTITFLNEFYTDNFGDELTTIFTLLENNGLINIKDVVDNIKPLSPVIQTFFESFFRNDIFNQVRTLANDLLTSDSANYLLTALYEQGEDEQIIPVGNIRLDRVKAELMLSMVRLLKLFYEIPDETDEAFSNIEPNSDDEISLMLANLLINAIQNRSWTPRDVNENLTPIVQEFFRLMTIFNAYFSFFDASKTFVVPDSQHLFSTEQNNYEFLATFADQTLGDSQYVQDRAVNLNYFLANIDYYFGSLSSQNPASAYRFQQGLFLLLNDPVANYQERNTYDNKASFLSDKLLDMFLVLGAKLTTGMPRTIFLNYFQNVTNKRTISETLVKPFLLGFVNGNDMNTALSVLKGALEGLVGLVPELVFFKDYLDDLILILDHIRQDFNENSLHHFLVDDLRPLFVGTKIINEELLNRWFLPGQNVNLQTLFAQPLSKILAVVSPEFSASNTQPIGEFLFNSSIPQLLNLLGVYANRLTPDFNVQTAPYGTSESNPNAAFRTFNIDLPTMHRFVINLIGEERGMNNLLSRIVDQLFMDGDNSLSRRFGLNVQGLLTALGMNGENSFQRTSFLGTTFQIFFPLFKDSTEDNLVFSEQTYQIDLLGRWLQNGFDLLKKLDEIGDYRGFINQIIRNNQTFSLKLRENELAYFLTAPDQIQSVAFLVTFTNPLTLSQTNYIFRVRRDQINDQYYFYQITSNK